MSRWNAKLIRANIALFTGDYAEARRWLADCQAEGIAAEHASQAMWLDAHTQPDPTERLRRLEGMAAQLDPSDPYAALARAALDAERAAGSPAAPNRGWVRALVVLLVLGIGAAVVALVINGNAPADVIPTAQPTIFPTPTLPPDRSRPLTGEGYTARYAEGLLTAVAIEDDSARVVRAVTGETIVPLDGARFYALEVAFECRAAICSAPPQAEVAVRLTDGSRIAPRRDLALVGQTVLEPVALGRITRGWLVFEVPVIGAVEALEITTRDAESGEIVTEIGL